METYIIDGNLHVEFTQEENHAVHCAAWVANRPPEAIIGRAILQDLDRIHKERFARTGKATPIKVTVKDSKPHPDRLEEQRERWAHEATRGTGFPLDVCRLVAKHAGSEAEAMGVLELAAMSGRKPQSIIDAVESYHGKEAARKGWTPTKEKP